MTGLFSAESPRPVAAVRIALSLVLLCEALMRWPYAVELYSTAGPSMPVFPGTFFEPPALGPTAAVLLQSLLVFVLLAVLVGWQTRASLLLACGLLAWLGLLDSPGTFKKYSVISLHILLLLSFTNAGAVWSLDRRLDRNRGRLVRLSPAWPRWLMRILIASIYLGAAMTKLKLPDFSTGDLLEFSLLDNLWGGNQWGHWLATRPHFLPIVSMAVVLFELAFPLLVWTSARRAMLLLAALFHLGLWGVMQLGFFSPVMLAALLAFVDERDLRRLVQTGSAAGSPEENPASGRIWNGRSMLGLAGYLAVAGLWVAAALGAQYASDWYGVFQVSSKRPGFAVLDSHAAETMLLEQKPAWADYLHRLELGSRAANGHAFGHNRFRQGATVYALARFQQQHPPLSLDWLFLAPDGREAGRLSRRLGEAYSHATAGFELTAEAPPGRYRVLLRIQGHEAGSVEFLLVTE